MVKTIRIFALVLLPLCLFGCSFFGHKAANSPMTPPMEARVPQSPLQVRVANVFNDTHNVYDVDVIGMLWNGMEQSLKEKGMLWTPGRGGEPYVMVGHIVYFQEPSLGKRLLPYMGRTVLKVRVDISRDGHHVATVDASRTIGYGKGMWTLHSSRKVFREVAREVIRKAAPRL